MSAPTSLMSNNHYLSHSPVTKTAAVAACQATNKMGSSGANKSDNFDKIDLIECKFNELAKKIFDELKQASHSRDFFQALDLILNEPQKQQAAAKQSARLKLFISSATDPKGQQATNQQQQQQQQRRQQHQQQLAENQKKLDNDIKGHQEDHLELKRKCELLMERQRQQQEQLDSHQQILFDNQYRSLPSEITGARLSAPTTIDTPKKCDNVANGSSRKLAEPQPRPNQVAKQQVISETNDNLQKATLVERRRNASADKLNLLASNHYNNNNSSNQTNNQQQQQQQPRRLQSQQQHQQQQQQSQRSAIPTSTILSGISQLKPADYPLIKSATTGSFNCSDGSTTTGSNLIRQSSLRLKTSTNNNDQRQQPQQQARKDNAIIEGKKQEQQIKTATVLTPSEKLKQRRPTKAAIVDTAQTINNHRSINRAAQDGNNDDDDDSDEENDDDDDDEDEDYEYENLVARRAYLNQRFIQPSQSSQADSQSQQKQSTTNNNSQIIKSKTMSDAKNHLSVPASGRQQQQQQQQQQQVVSKAGESAATVAAASRLSPVMNAANQPQQQRQRLTPNGSQIARSNTIAVATTVGGGAGGGVLVGVSTSPRSKLASQVVVSSKQKLKQQQQPRSINVIEDNSDDDDDDENDFDDDDDDDDEQPRSINGLMSSHSGNMISGQLYKPHMNYSTSLLGNHRLSDDDEIIIIPTAQSPSSFIMSASQSPVNPQHNQQHLADDTISGNLDEFNERFSISRTKSFWEKLANSKKPSAASGGGGGGGGTGGDTSTGQQQQQHNSQNSGDTNNNSNKMIHHQHSTIKSAFDRLDSTGGSGNSHYSGCSSNSSTSGDEQQQQQQNAYANRMARAGGIQVAPVSRGQQRSPNKLVASGMNPTINQLVHQEQLNRSDRFRQTR